MSLLCSTQLVDSWPSSWNPLYFVDEGRLSYSQWELSVLLSLIAFGAAATGTLATGYQTAVASQWPLGGVWALLTTVFGPVGGWGPVLASVFGAVAGVDYTRRTWTATVVTGGSLVVGLLVSPVPVVQAVVGSTPLQLALVVLAGISTFVAAVSLESGVVDTRYGPVSGDSVVQYAVVAAVVLLGGGYCLTGVSMAVSGGRPVAGVVAIALGGFSTLGAVSVLTVSSVERTRRALLVGPHSSGRRSVAGGLRRAVKDLSVLGADRLDDPETVTELEQLLTDDGRFPEPDHEGSESRWQTHVLRYRLGRFFPTHVELAVVCDPGELDRIVDATKDTNAGTDSRTERWVRRLTGQSRTRWRDAIASADDAESAGRYTEAVADATTVADDVLCVLPLDDFVGTVVEHPADRTLYPASLSTRLRQWDDGVPSSDELDKLAVSHGGTAKRVYPTYRREGTVLVDVGRPQRQAPSSYLRAYEGLHRATSNTTNVRPVVTMADLAVNHFEYATQDSLETLDNIFPRDFAEFVRRRYLTESSVYEDLSTEECQLLETVVSPDRPYVLWYGVTDPSVDGRAIDLSGPTPLRGAGLLLQSLGR
ncbi:hypothetical protein SAMN04487949_2917 [Halogranum gelatinilyticum]|uniref:Uncharacterized protein n=1 Tax=Halogranum gelatinilyticum TaxID=660521 RepID=A0A1G9XBB2_9EURY|nr:hypothetical protein SAMN04487949_2917 [Halogranum gelatinilyticum]